MPDAFRSLYQPIRRKLLECDGAHSADGATRTFSSLKALIRKHLVLDDHLDLAFTISIQGSHFSTKVKEVKNLKPLKEKVKAMKGIKEAKTDVKMMKQKRQRSEGHLGV